MGLHYGYVGDKPHLFPQVAKLLTHWYKEPVAQAWLEKRFSTSPPSENLPYCIIATTDGDEAVGMVTINPPGKTTIEFPPDSPFNHMPLIGNLSVLPGYQRQGVGRKLIEHACQYLSTHGERHAYIWEEANAHNSALYEGMQEVKERYPKVSASVKDPNIDYPADSQSDVRVFAIDIDAYLAAARANSLRSSGVSR